MNILPSSSSHLSLLSTSFQCINDTTSNQLDEKRQEDTNTNIQTGRKFNIKDGISEGVEILKSWNRYRQVGLTGEKGLTLLRRRGKCENMSEEGPLVKGKASFMLKVKSNQYTTSSTILGKSLGDNSAKSRARKQGKNETKRRLSALSNDAKAVVKQAEVQESAAKTRMRLKLEANDNDQQNRYSISSSGASKKRSKSLISSVGQVKRKYNTVPVLNKNNVKNDTNQPSFKRYILRQLYRSKVARLWASKAHRQVTGATTKLKRMIRKQAVKAASSMACSLRQHYKKELVKQIVMVGKNRLPGELDNNNSNNSNINNSNKNTQTETTTRTVTPSDILAVRVALTKCFPLIGAFVVPKRVKNEKHPGGNKRLRKALGIKNNKKNSCSLKSQPLQCIESGIVIHESKTKVIIATGMLKDSKTYHHDNQKEEKLSVPHFTLSGRLTSVAKHLVKEI